jgi:mono/diheme cytochrome c family protein
MSPKQLFPVMMLAAGAESPLPGATAFVSFHKDVEPVLQAHCQACHRPGEIGPMPFLSYQEVRPWAKAIKEAVLTGKMPLWFADPGVQHYQNDARLSSAEIEIIKAWVDVGAPEGNKGDAPPPRAFVEGWTI